MLIQEPLRPILRAVLFESSGFDAESVQLRAFAWPLYVPTDHIGLAFCVEIGPPGGWWEWNETNDATELPKVLHGIRRQGLPFLQRFDSPLHFAQQVRGMKTSSDVRYVLQGIAYSFAYSERFDLALKVLDELKDSIHSVPDPPEWFTPIVDRGESLRRAIQSGPDAARRLLLQWEDYSVNALRLEANKGKPSVR